MSRNIQQTFLKNNREIIETITYLRGKLIDMNYWSAVGIFQGSVENKSLGEYIKGICKRINVDYDEVIGPSRIDSISIARHVVATVVREKVPNATNSQIGAELNRDRTTILHSTKKVYEGLQHDGRIAYLYRLAGGKMDCRPVNLVYNFSTLTNMIELAANAHGLTKEDVIHDKYNRRRCRTDGDENIRHMIAHIFYRRMGVGADLIRDALGVGSVSSVYHMATKGELCNPLDLMNMEKAMTDI